MDLRLRANPKVECRDRCPSLPTEQSFPLSPERSVKHKRGARRRLRWGSRETVMGRKRGEGRKGTQSYRTTRVLEQPEMLGQLVGAVDAGLVLREAAELQLNLARIHEHRGPACLVRKEVLAKVWPRGHPFRHGAESGW